MGDNNTHIGKSERASQNRLIKLFTEHLGYTYLGNWEEEERVLPIEVDLLKAYLLRQGNSEVLADKAIEKLIRACTVSGSLYEANKKVYTMLRYGVNTKEEKSDLKEDVQLIDWEDPSNNDFGIAEEVTVKSIHDKRPDLVLYVNGIALGVIELKNSRKGVEWGIRQNLDNQKTEFIERFFPTMQLCMAGNDTQGMRYGTIKTSEKYYLTWKEESEAAFDYILDKHLSQFCEKGRLLEIIHDFVVFDKGVKKLCRPNQYFGIKAAQQRVLDHEGGVLWHTQGSGKSLTMVWLSKWILEHVTDSRILIITDREELDDQIEKLYLGVGEQIKRTTSGRDLIAVLNAKEHSIIGSLIHKFGRANEEGDIDAFIEELKKSLGSDFKAKGKIHVFVDECHRTQSGKLHAAMKIILPDVLIIGFTGTPLLNKDKESSIETFGTYIGEPYRFDEAVADGVVLDLMYEARDVEQFITDQQSIDDWFDIETKGLTAVAKAQLKIRWGTMQKVLGSKSRLERIVFDIVRDFRSKPRLSDGSGNALLVSGSVYQACRYFDLFQRVGFKECAIITSYEPHHGDIKGEETGEGDTDNLAKYRIYNEMLKGRNVEDFEAEAKALFIDEPARMKLLIVVDKLLTGFDAPSCTYLYIDKSMRDHGLFQAICRVNRVDDESKDYGFIIDYKDLFNSLEDSINDYTSKAFDQYDKDDVSGLLKDRLELGKERLDSALETVEALCEPVHPQDEPAFIRYFCGDTSKPEDLKEHEDRRIEMYKSVVKLIRAYANVANDLHKMMYTVREVEQIKTDVKFYTDMRDAIKLASGEHLDFKRFEPGMRQLMDMYIDADRSKTISDFENASLIDLIVNISEPTGEYIDKRKREAMCETIENNVRKVIIEERETNPAYYDRMSALLAELIRQRKEDTEAYTEYLKRIKDLAAQVSRPNATGYPSNLDTAAKRSLYDNLEKNTALALALDSVIQSNKLDGWRDHPLKFKKLKLAVKELLGNDELTDGLMPIIKAQREY